MRVVKAFAVNALLIGLFTCLYFYQADYSYISAKINPLNVSYASVDNLAYAEINLPLFRNATQIFFNRVPKCASTTAFKMMQQLIKPNKFYFKNVWSNKEHFYTDPTDEALCVDAEFEKVKNKKALLSGHYYFKDFSKSKVFRNRTLPIYINLIREPIDRLQSWFYFIRYQPNHVREMSNDSRDMSYSECVKKLDPECTHSSNYMAQLTYFCGAMPFCRLPEMGALQQAKRNVVRHYAVVGMKEELRDFFVALECVLPSWFTGAAKEYDKAQAQNLSVKNKLVNIPHSRTLDPESQGIMKTLLKEDYDFYYFIKQRFDFYMKQIKHRRV